MANCEYTVSCIYCKHFQYSPNTIEINPWKEEFCAITYKKHSPNDIICDFFELRSGIHTNKIYPKKAAIKISRNRQHSYRLTDKKREKTR